jgi:hypothetical protein
LGTQVALALGVSLAYLALALGIHAALAGVVDPESWGAARVAAALALGMGLALATRYVRFDTRGPWFKRALRYAAGFLGVLVFWRGLKLLTGEDSQPVEIALALRYVRLTLMILWVVVAAPWVFIRTKLADAA